MNNTFDFTRLIQLMKADLWLQRKTILIVAVTLLVVLALLPFTFANTGAAYLGILYIGCFVITSLAFKDLHDRDKAHTYLLLPCSHLEKFISKWFLTSIAYIVATLILFYGFLFLSAAINKAMYGGGIYILGPIQPGFITSMTKYVALQSIILLGATIFKRNVLLKTILVVAGVLLTINLLKVLFAGSLIAAISNPINTVGPMFWVVLALFFLYVTYLRITETELK